jgi:ethanolamine utilization protein EutN
MNVARVIGQVTSTMKHQSLVGWKLLVVLPLTSDMKHRDGEPMLVIDPLGAGAGDNVIITSDGVFGGKLVGTPATPVRWSVIGILDERRNENEQ